MRCTGERWRIACNLLRFYALSTRSAVLNLFHANDPSKDFGQCCVPPDLITSFLVGDVLPKTIAFFWRSCFRKQLFNVYWAITEFLANL